MRNVAQEKYETPTWAPRGARQTAETDQVRCKAIKVEPPQTPWAPTEANAKGDTPLQEQPYAKDWDWQRRHGARGATMQTGFTNETTAKWMARQDIAIELQKGPPHKRTRTPPRRSEGWSRWATPTGPQTEEQNAREVLDPWRVRTKERGKNSHRLAAAVRATASAPAATGCQENPQAEAQAQPEGDNTQHKRLPADRRKCRAGGLGSASTDREEPSRVPRTPENPQPQWGQPAKEAPAAAGR